MVANKLVTIAAYSEILQAEQSQATLEQAGMKSVITEDPTHSLYGYATGAVKLQVRETDVDKAKEALGWPYMAVRAEVVGSSIEAGVIRTVLKFDGGPTEPIAPASLYALPEGKEKKLDLHRIADRAGQEITFETYDAEYEPLRPGGTYAFQSWWSEDQLALVKDETIVWRRQKFEPSDAVEYHEEDGHIAWCKLEEDEVPTEGKIIPEGWEHEHCRLCWETISPYEDDENYGYTDGSDWICEACYKQYLAWDLRRKLG
jgi:hypothetical protein